MQVVTFLAEQSTSRSNSPIPAELLESGQLMDLLVSYGLLAFAALVFILIYSANKSDSPLTSIFSRWGMWFLFSLSGAYLSQTMFGSARPFWSLAGMYFLGWLLMETMFSWMAIAAYSKAQLPLFPKYRKNEDGDEWPNQKRYILLRDELRKAGFTKVSALKAEIEGIDFTRASFYDDASKTTRLQVSFIPQRTGAVVVSFSFWSLKKTGGRVVTDNHFMPFGGFYPDDWVVNRCPWVRKFASLYQSHKHQLEKAGELIPWSDDPLDELMAQQVTLERTNLERGFLVPYEYREEFGQISRDGRYRIWKEAWMLKYLGRPLSR